MSIKEEAIEFATGHDLAVIPITPGTKRPLEADWPNKGRRTAEDIDAMPEDNYGVLCEGITVIDFDFRNMDGVRDPDDDNETAMVTDLVRRAYGLGPTLEIVTGSGGVHLYYKGEVAQGTLEKGIDIKSGLASQVIGPGSLHIDTGIAYRVWQDQPMAEVPDYLAERQAFNPSTGEFTYEKGKSAALTEEGLPEGGRNEGLFKYLCRQRKLGQDRKSIVMLAHMTNKTECHPPLPEEEVNSIIESAMSYDITGFAELTSGFDAIQPKVQPAEADDMVKGWVTDTDLERLPPPVFLVDNMVPDRGLFHIVGKSYSGKSFVAIDLARSLAAGKEEWLGHKIREGGAKVAYVALEGEFDLHARVEAWDSAYGSVPKDRMRWFLNDDFDFGDSAAEQLQVLKDTGFDFDVLIIDTQSLAASQFDENSNTDMTKLMKALKRVGGPAYYDCLIVLVHHAGHTKNADRERGASALFANMDGSMFIHSNEGKNPRRLEMKKLKAGPLLEPISFILSPEKDSVVIELTSAIEILAEEHPGFVEWTEGEEKILNILKDTTQNGNMTVAIDLGIRSGYSNRTVKSALKRYKEKGHADCVETPGKATRWWYIEPDEDVAEDVEG